MVIIRIKSKEFSNIWKRVHFLWPNCIVERYHMLSEYVKKHCTTIFEEARYIWKESCDKLMRKKQHMTPKLTWCKRHSNFTIDMFKIMFTYESQIQKYSLHRRDIRRSKVNSLRRNIFATLLNTVISQFGAEL